MKAVILKEAGSVENLQFAEVEKPVLQNDEVLVKVASVSINPVDVKARSYDGVLGWIFGEERPVILGWDISGEVVETGNGVTDFKIGDQVFGMVNFFGNGKAYAEYVASPSKHLALKPKNTTYQQAAASTMAASTAYQALVDVAKIKKGDKVLVHGASGGVGHFAVQIAKHFGAYVIGTSSAKNRDFVLSLGADQHIDYMTENFAEKVQDADIVLDTIQGETLLHSVDAVRPGGIIVTLPTPEISQEVKEKADMKQVNITFMMVASKKETITAVAQLLEQEALKPHIHKTFPFEEIAKVHLEVETNRVVGKVVINI
ncbi:NADP-dependent oxidoreductase [Chryseobacterium geocarposphaerae]|uniref:NADPH:quinone reductase-like Zn-dependent oxidoreductase n=1 Tax=Chryseobacterium geocarposphaerae TaxID=1416776 RepID=A0A2M9BXX2_9FLAO|nr:NADP-dependent oxidoreductase [Chryseobacterium geocarposphaerae]PJJ62922.1 NADPH:quinone reductase-like Zn-dependent oxidoreductase [Chryseobacterium geocarposphaerae]